MTEHIPLKAVLLFLLVMAFSACESANPTPTMTRITVQLNWTHDAQFAGFYVADQNGYYAEEGLSATFVEGGLNVDPVSPLLNDTAQFGVAVADRLILTRSDGKPLRAFATIFRRSPVALFSLTDQNIRHPEDLIGKTINASADTAPTLHAMLFRAGITSNQYTEVNVGPDFDRLYSGEIHVFVGFITTGAVNVQRAGHTLNFIYPDDYGVHFYGSSLIATDDFITANPELVRRFLRATLKGWTYAIENPEMVGSLIVKYKPDADPDLESAKMTASLPLVNTGEDQIGWMEPVIWEEMMQTLLEQEVLTAPIDITEVYTLQYIQELYGVPSE